ncbi:hypothetical protein [Streptomyces cadmiisoli]|uniref:hypothetical protein n=1 Tax=Streptomyces cadmiisoli TaxID=2184053 RepID=UPI003D752695
MGPELVEAASHSTYPLVGVPLLSGGGGTLTGSGTLTLGQTLILTGTLSSGTLTGSRTLTLGQTLILTGTTLTSSGTLTLREVLIAPGILSTGTVALGGTVRARDRRGRGTRGRGGRRLRSTGGVAPVRTAGRQSEPGDRDGNTHGNAARSGDLHETNSIQLW